jgi:hypothetical protein
MIPTKPDLLTSYLRGQLFYNPSRIRPTILVFTPQLQVNFNITPVKHTNEDEWDYFFTSPHSISVGNPTPHTLESSRAFVLQEVFAKPNISFLRLNELFGSKTGKSILEGPPPAQEWFNYILPNISFNLQDSKRSNYLFESYVPISVFGNLGYPISQEWQRVTYLFESGSTIYANFRAEPIYGFNWKVSDATRYASSSELQPEPNQFIRVDLFLKGFMINRDLIEEIIK